MRRTQTSICASLFHLYSRPHSSDALYCDNYLQAYSANLMSSFFSVPTKVRQLPFFPASFPDETFYSLISRYFLLSAQNEDEVSFEVLFGVPTSQMDFRGPAPFRLKYFVRQLPGQSRILLGKILEANCFVALVLPVITAADWDFPDPKFAETNICLDCAAEDRDDASISMAYVHRIHQLPGVTACWRHATKLVSACPRCAKSFRQPGKFLTAPLVDCGCSWYPSVQTTGIRAAKSDVEFAMNAHRVFEQRSYKTPASRLISFFEMHVDHSAFQKKHGRHRWRAPISVGIAEKLEQEYSTIEVASAVARYIQSGRCPNAWVANLNPHVLQGRARHRQNIDDPILLG